MKKIKNWHYSYKEFDVINHGYYPPDKCIWWEAINKETGCADYHAQTKGDIKSMIDNDFNKNKNQWVI